ncbi:MAG: hypothetical protein VYD05_10100, partial [Planctomycetota bacterium]|nr:hypothetical protein [Planctomycetota bacterium]
MYCQLWRAAHGGAAPSPADVRALFVAAQCAALPQRARQSAYLVTVRGLPLGCRVGGEAACPVCASHDVQRTDSHEHAVLGCPLAALVWLRVLEGWVVFSPSDAWAAEPVAAACGPPVAGAPTTDATTGALQWSTPFLSRHWRGGTSAQPEHGTAFAWSPAARLAVLTGARPAGQRAHAEAFALLRGVVLDAILGVHHAAGLVRAAGSASPTADLFTAAASTYHRVRAAFQEALTQERARMVLLGAWRRRAGCAPAAVAAPLQNWEERWTPLVVARSPSGKYVQRVLRTHFDRIPLPVPAWARAAGAVRPDWTPPPILAVGCHVVYAGSCPAVPSPGATPLGPPPAAGWGLVVLRA